MLTITKVLVPEGLQCNYTWTEATQTKIWDKFWISQSQVNILTMKLHEIVLRVSSKYIANHFSKGYIKKELWHLCKSSWKCFGNVWVCWNQSQQFKRNSERSKLKAMAAHFMANSAQRVNHSVGDLRAVAKKIWGWLHVMQIIIRTHPACPTKRKLRMNLDCSRIVKKIAVVSGIFVEGRRRTLLYSCKWNE